MFLCLAVCLVGVVVLSAVEQRGAQVHEILMIALAAYTFTRVTIAILRLAQSRRHTSPVDKTLRNIAFADAVVGGYKKVESAVVGGYTKIEDKFVDAYLTKEGETVEQAKARLKNDQK